MRICLLLAHAVRFGGKNYQEAVLAGFHSSAIAPERFAPLHAGLGLAKILLRNNFFYQPKSFSNQRARFLQKFSYLTNNFFLPEKVFW